MNPVPGQALTSWEQGFDEAVSSYERMFKRA
jgi:hypothetical protein